MQPQMGRFDAIGTLFWGHDDPHPNPCTYYIHISISIMNIFILHSMTFVLYAMVGQVTPKMPPVVGTTPKHVHETTRYYFDFG